MEKEIGATCSHTFFVPYRMIGISPFMGSLCRILGGNSMRD